MNQFIIDTIGVTTADLSMKSWIEDYCPNSGTAVGSVGFYDVRLGISFQFVFEGEQDMTDIEKSCYPHLYTTFDGPGSEENIVSDLALVSTELEYTFRIDSNENIGETITIFGSTVSDVYHIDSSYGDTKYEHTLYAVIQAPSSNTLPVFATEIPKLFIEAEYPFSFTLPEIIDP